MGHSVRAALGCKGRYRILQQDCGASPSCWVALLLWSLGRRVRRGGVPLERALREGTGCMRQGAKRRRQTEAVRGRGFRLGVPFWAVISREATQDQEQGCALNLLPSQRARVLGQEPFLRPRVAGQDRWSWRQLRLPGLVEAWRSADTSHRSKSREAHLAGSLLLWAENIRCIRIGGPMPAASRRKATRPRLPGSRPLRDSRLVEVQAGALLLQL
jgi:hypothetical protein